MTDDNPFKVKLGRIMSPGGTGRFVSFAGRVRRAAQKSARQRSQGPRSNTVAKQSFSRRVIVKFSLAKMQGNGGKIFKAHLDYVARESAAQENEKGGLYNAVEPDADTDSFAERCKDDRHYFKIIVSPEDGKDIADLTRFTRDLMIEVQRDMDTKLEWVAADHYDTGRPHSHIILRGVRDDGKDLVIPREYISYGMRDRAEHLATLELGPVTQIDVAKKLAVMTRQERFTTIDKDLLYEASENIVNLSEIKQDGSDWSQRFKIWRVKHLARMGLAEKVGRGKWKLDEKLERTLRRMGDRGDILKARHKAMTINGLERPSRREPIYDPLAGDAKPMTGRVLKVGIFDDVNDRSFIVLDTLQGEAIFVETGKEANVRDIQEDMIVTIRPQTFQPKSSDYTIDEIAAKRGGIYSPSAHEAADPKASEAYIQAHIRRLEAMRRSGHAERNKDGTWQVPPNYLKRAREFERKNSAGKPVQIDLKSRLSLSKATEVIGRTWLDEELASANSAVAREGFGNEVEKAKINRMAFLNTQQLLGKSGDVTKETLSQLESLDLKAAGAALSKELDKPYVEAPTKGSLSGTFRKTVERPSGKYAVIEKSKEFTLVPWRETMDRNLGRTLKGTIGRQTISWALSKGRDIS